MQNLQSKSLLKHNDKINQALAEIKKVLEALTTFNKVNVKGLSKTMNKNIKQLIPAAGKHHDMTDFLQKCIYVLFAFLDVVSLSATAHLIPTQDIKIKTTTENKIIAFKQQFIALKENLNDSKASTKIVDQDNNKSLDEIKSIIGSSIDDLKTLKNIVYQSAEQESLADYEFLSLLVEAAECIINPSKNFEPKASFMLELAIRELSRDPYDAFIYLAKKYLLNRNFLDKLDKYLINEKQAGLKLRIEDFSFAIDRQVEMLRLHWQGKGDKNNEKAVSNRNSQEYIFAATFYARAGICYSEAMKYASAIDRDDIQENVEMLMKMQAMFMVNLVVLHRIE